MLNITRIYCRNVHSKAHRPSFLPIPIPLSVQLFINEEVRDHLEMKNSDRKTRMRLPCDSHDLSVGGMRRLIEERHCALKDKPYVLRLQLMQNQRQISPKGSDQICALLNDAQRRYTEEKKLRGNLGPNQRNLAFGAGAATAEEEGVVSLQVFVDPKPGIFPPLENAFKNSLSPQTPFDSAVGSGAGAGVGVRGGGELVAAGSENDSTPHPMSYLTTMADPSTSAQITLLSFYAFHPVRDPRALQAEMLSMWKPFQAVGRIYVAEEGVNGQLAVPSNVLYEFHQSCKLISMFKALPNGLFLNVDHEISRISFEENPPFRSLNVRVRPQVLADGFVGEEKKGLDWQRAGRELSALEWNTAMDNPSAIVLDCRNSYESDVGKFDGAVPLNTRVFKESFKALEDMLQQVDKDTPVLTYCTGGIRCVKVNAYLLQRMGFTNVGRLRGGIVSYARDLQHGLGAPATDSADQVKSTTAETGSRASVPRPRDLGLGIASAASSSSSSSSSPYLSKFKGVNYVFDERMVSRITDDVISHCSMCGKPSDAVTNCRAVSCHARFVQCGACATAYAGCCSAQCRRNLSTEAADSSQLQATTRTEAATESEAEKALLTNTIIDASPETAQKSSEDSTALDRLTEYCEHMSTSEPEILRNLAEETARVYAERPGASRMLSGRLQGRILALLTSLSGASSVLELGAFTGYSALCFAEAIQVQATKNLREGKRAGVLTCEIDEEASSVARRYFHQFNKRTPNAAIIDFRAPLAAKDLIAQARAEGWQFDVVFIDADKKGYEGYVRDLLGEGQGDGNAKGASDQRCLLNDGALLLVDNTLWKGLVLKCSEDGGSAGEQAALPKEIASCPKPSRQQVLAKAMHSFNQFVRQHPKLTTVVLPIRDGLSCIRYNKGN
jgi:predicted sulfurtransferase/predicted O-methyltransferase YrrM